MSSKAAAIALKDQGNKLFAEKDFASAILKYSEAIEEDSENVVLYSNRSACYANLSRFAEAEKDAKECVTRDPNFLKGYYRLSVACCEQGQYEDAVNWVQSGLEKDPNNEDLKRQLKVVKSRQAASENRVTASNPMNSAMTLTQEQQAEAVEVKEKIDDMRRDLGTVKSSSGLLFREKRRNNICRTEIASEKYQACPLFLSVGKAFIFTERADVLSHLDESERKMEKRSEELRNREQYLERRIQGQEGTLRDIFSSASNSQKS